MKIGVMQGNLGEFDLAQVLQVVGLGRQYTGVELTLPGGGTGTIFVKSGQVVGATAPDREGAEAFRDLFRTAQGEFLVYRADAPAELGQPIGHLNQLLVDAIARQASEAPYAERENPTHLGVAPPAPGASSPAASSPVSSPLPTAVAVTTPVEQPLGAEQRVTSRPPPVAKPPVAKTSERTAAVILGVVSPKGGSGKSTVSLNLSLSLARRGHSVILVDGDVNGDVLSAIDARDRAKKGALDVVTGNATVAEALLDTVLPRFKLMPAVGKELPDPEQLALDPRRGWPKLLSELSRRADIVVVDTPSGMFGPTRPILGAVTHVLGVLQAEVLASRSFTRFREGLDSLPDDARPAVAGVVLNMLQTRHDASMSVFQDALVGLPAAWLLDTTIPRHPAFLDATHQGVPLRQLDEDAPPPVAFLFDNLAGELAGRLELRRAAARPQKLLL